MCYPVEIVLLQMLQLPFCKTMDFVSRYRAAQQVLDKYRALYQTQIIYNNNSKCSKLFSKSKCKFSNNNNHSFSLLMEALKVGQATVKILTINF